MCVVLTVRDLAALLLAVMYFVLGVAEGTYPAYRAKASYTVPRNFVHQSRGMPVAHTCVHPTMEKHKASSFFACLGAFQGSKFASVWAPPGCAQPSYLPRYECARRSSEDCELAGMRMLRHVKPRLDGDAIVDDVVVVGGGDADVEMA